MTRLRGATLVVAAVSAGALVTASPRDPERPRADIAGIAGIAGAFTVIVTYADGSDYEARIIFAPGRTAREGSTAQVSELDFDADYALTDELGGWWLSAPGRYHVERTGYLFEGAPGAYLGQLREIAEIALSRDGATFTGTQITEEYDAEGTLVSREVGQTLEGERLRPDARSPLAPPFPTVGRLSPGRLRWLPTVDHGLRSRPSRPGPRAGNRGALDARVIHARGRDTTTSRPAGTISERGRWGKDASLRRRVRSDGSSRGVRFEALTTPASGE